MNPTDVERVEHARRLLAAAPDDLIKADWSTLHWIAVQVPQLLGVIDHLTALRPVVGAEVHGYDHGIPVRTLNLPEKPCGCGVLLGEVCDCTGPGWVS